MEALWTRYLPISFKVRELIASGTIGEVRRVIADTSFSEDVEKKWGTQNRIINMDLAGGALLDLGIYALTWVFQILYHLQPEPRQAPSILSSVIKYKTRADEQTAILLTFPKCPSSAGSTRSDSTHGIATCGLCAGLDPDLKGSSGPPIKIQGTKGGHGMFWEVDEAADGNLQSETLNWEEILLIMETMDKVREQSGIAYPHAIETTEYPVTLPK